MKTIYDYRANKVDLCKQFEARIWQSIESFLDYYHDKIIKANRVPIVEEEILDFIIDGIPDYQLKNQARMQNFLLISELVQIFKKVTIRPNIGLNQRLKSAIDNNYEVKMIKSVAKMNKVR